MINSSYIKEMVLGEMPGRGRSPLLKHPSWKSQVAHGSQKSRE